MTALDRRAASAQSAADEYQCVLSWGVLIGRCVRHPAHTAMLCIGGLALAYLSKTSSLVHRPHAVRAHMPRGVSLLVVAHLLVLAPFRGAIKCSAARGMGLLLGLLAAEW